MARIKYETDASQSVRAQKALTDAQEKYNKTIGETPQKLSKAEKAAKRLAEQADPQAKYNRQMFKLAEAVQKGGLEQEKALALTRKYQQALDRTGQSGQKAFGDKMLTNVATMGSSLLSFGAAVAAIADNFARVDANAKRAAESVVSSLGSIGELQQVSGTPEQFHKNLGYAYSLRRSGAFTDDTSAVDFAISSQNAGFTEEQRAYLAAVAERRQVSPQNLAKFGTGLTKVAPLYPGLTLEQIGDKTLAAAGFTNADASKTAEAVSKISALVKTLGFDSDNALAGLVANEESAANIDIGGTNYASFLKQLSARNLNKGTLRGSVAALEARFAAGENKYKVLGDSTAVAGFDALVNERDEYDNALAAIRNSAGAMASRYYLPSEPGVYAAHLAEQSKGYLADSARGQARPQALFEAVRDRMIAYQNDRGRYQRAGWEEYSASWSDYFGLERNYIKSNWQGEGLLPPELQREAGQFLLDTATSESERNQILGVLNRIATSNERMESNSRASTSTKQEN